MSLNLLEPILYVVEGALLGAVVDEHDAHGSLVIRLSDRAEPLLACCVPDLQFDALVLHIDRLYLEVNSCHSTNAISFC